MARDAGKEDKNLMFYCPNQNCGAELHICNLEGVSSSYFRAGKLKGHCKGCDFGSSNDFDSSKYDEKQFKFDSALELLTVESQQQSKKKTPSEHKNGEPTPKPPHTILQIYRMCKSLPCKESYNEEVIGQMLLDNRSAYMYPKGVFGWRLIEGKCKVGSFYDKSKNEIHLIFEADKVKYNFILHFVDNSLFKDLRSKLYNNRDKLIVVASKWNKTEIFNVFSAEITSKKQLAIIK